MATIKKRVGLNGRISWQVRIRHRGSPELTKTFILKMDAIEWAAQTEREIEEFSVFGASRQHRRRKVSELIERYLETELPKLAESDRLHRAGQLEWWNDRIGKYRVKDVGPALLAQHLESLKNSGRGPATVNRYHAAMARVFSVAKRRWQSVVENPFVSIEKEKEPQIRVRFLSDEERSALLEACRESGSRKLFPFVLTALRTGARQGSIRALRWRDVDMGRRRIVFQETKNRSRVSSYIADDLMAALREWGSVRPIHGGPVFGSHPRRAFDDAVKRAGIENFTFHDLRHCCASYMAMEGASIHQIMAQLGLRTVQMVMKYAHLMPGAADSVIERISQKQLP